MQFSRHLDTFWRYQLLDLLYTVFPFELLVDISLLLWSILVFETGIELKRLFFPLLILVVLSETIEHVSLTLKLLLHLLAGIAIVHLDIDLDLACLVVQQVHIFLFDGHGVGPLWLVYQIWLRCLTIYYGMSYYLLFLVLALIIAKILD